MQWCHLWCYMYCVIQILMSSHDQIGHALYFNCLCLRNAMVSLTTMSASCDTDTTANGVTWPKHHVAPHFDHLQLRYAKVPLTIPSVSWCQHQWSHMTHVAPHFNHWDLRNTIVPFMTLLASCATDTNASGIMLCWHQWHKVMLIPMPIVWHIKKVMLHLIFFTMK